MNRVNIERLYEIAWNGAEQGDVNACHHAVSQLRTAVGSDSQGVLETFEKIAVANARRGSLHAIDEPSFGGVPGSEPPEVAAAVAGFAVDNAFDVEKVSAGIDGLLEQGLIEPSRAAQLRNRYVQPLVRQLVGAIREDAGEEPLYSRLAALVTGAIERRVLAPREARIVRAQELRPEVEKWISSTFEALRVGEDRFASVLVFLEDDRVDLDQRFKLRTLVLSLPLSEEQREGVTSILAASRPD